ncbi:MAG: lytic transglycosylase domain-containing protein [Anaeromyxobacteraceae bacterium]
MLAPAALAALLAATPAPAKVSPPSSPEPGADPAYAAYLSARAHLAAGRVSQVLGPLDGLEARLPALADRILFMRGEALTALLRSREALDAYAAVPDGSVLAPEARIALARGADLLGERERALATLAPLLGRPAPAEPGRADPAATALLLAGKLRGTGRGADPAAGRKDLLTCWSAHPLAPEAAACLAAARALPAPHGGPPEPDVVLTRAERLLEANRTDAALAALAKVKAGEPSPDDAFACRVRAATGRAYRREREHRKVVATLGPVVERCREPAVVSRALFVLAGSTAITGDRAGAIALHRRLAEKYPESPLADDALFAAADLLASDGRLAEARAALGALAKAFPDGDVRDEARFRAAWLAWKEGDLDAAVAALAEIEATEVGVDPYEHARAAYWRARLLAGKDAAGAAAAKALWAELVARYPADYYGLLARSRLAEAGGEGGFPAPVKPVSIEPTWDAGPLADDPHLPAARALLAMGLLEDAVAELEAVDLSRAAGAGPEPLLVVADLLDRAGDHRGAHQLLRTKARAALPRAPRAEDLRAWRIAYPPAYRDLVKRWAPPAGVPVDLLQALMREESALEPKALSPAGAVGLTQLMVPTARAIAKGAGLPRPSRADLMKADVNIRIGARYLGQLVKRFDGSLPLALAAYNAGPNAVARWVEERGAGELDAFVEQIPYDETRGYVKRVLRSYASYRLLYGEGDGPTSALTFTPAPRG